MDSNDPYSIATNSYDAYGIPDSQSGDDITTKGRFRYTGQAWIPELEMYYYKARIYSYKLGRFMQTDPIGYEDQFNLYGYVGNDPINGIDPTGMDTVCAFNGPCTHAPTKGKTNEIIVTGKRPQKSENEPNEAVLMGAVQDGVTENRQKRPQRDDPSLADRICGLLDFLPGDGVNAGLRGGGGLGLLFVGSSNFRISDAGRITYTNTTTIGAGAGLIGPFQAGPSSAEPTEGVSYETGAVGGVSLGAALLKLAKGEGLDIGSVGAYAGYAETRRETITLGDLGC